MHKDVRELKYTMLVKFFGNLYLLNELTSDFWIDKHEEEKLVQKGQGKQKVACVGREAAKWNI